MKILRWIRHVRFAASLWVLRRMFVGRSALWVSEIGGQTAPQMQGSIKSLRIRPGTYGDPDSITFAWAAPGMSFQDIKQVDIRKLRRDRKLAAWVFTDD